MLDSPIDPQSARWATLTQELRSLSDVLSKFTLVGVLDRDINHISSMQEEIDRRTREALVAYWLERQQGELPQVRS